MEWMEGGKDVSRGLGRSSLPLSISPSFSFCPTLPLPSLGGKKEGRCWGAGCGGEVVAEGVSATSLAPRPLH